MTIGPEPMSRIFFRSVRRGMAGVLHRRRVMRSEERGGQAGAALRAPRGPARGGPESILCAGGGGGHAVVPGALPGDAVRGWLLPLGPVAGRAGVERFGERA